MTGGVRIPDSKTSNKMISLCLQSYSSLFIVKDMRMTCSPRPSVRTGAPPLTSAGGKDAYRIGPQTIHQTALQIPLSPSFKIALYFKIAKRRLNYSLYIIHHSFFINPRAGGKASIHPRTIKTESCLTESEAALVFIIRNGCRWG